MKINKITLGELKIKSFVTNIEKETSHTAKGGSGVYTDFCGTLATCVTKAIQGCGGGSHNQEK